MSGPGLQTISWAELRDLRDRGPFWKLADDPELYRTQEAGMIVRKEDGWHVTDAGRAALAKMGE